MDDGKWLKVVGELGELPRLVFEKICRAAGMVYEPTHVRRMATAKGDEIREIAQAEADASRIRARADWRIAAEGLRHQQNLEAITLKALPHLTDQAKPEQVDNDWLVSFFELSRNASKEDIQSLWARILAGEFNSPNSFAKRTLRLVADFERRDAEQFTTLCRFGVNLERIPLIYDMEAPIYTEAGLTYPVLVHLQTIGLLRFSDVVPLQSRALPSRINLQYFSTLFELTLPGAPAPTDHRFDFGHIILSQAGGELAKIAGPTEVDGFADYLVKRWESRGIVCVRTSIPPPIEAS